SFRPLLPPETVNVVAVEEVACRRGVHRMGVEAQQGCREKEHGRGIAQCATWGPAGAERRVPCGSRLLSEAREGSRRGGLRGSSWLRRPRPLEVGAQRPSSRALATVTAGAWQARGTSSTTRTTARK